MSVQLASKIESFLKKLCEKKGQVFLLGLSGGIDSLALFTLLTALQEKFSFTLHAAYVDHGWRQESAQEALELQKLCQQKNIPFHTNRLEANPEKNNLEERARKQRYAFFKTTYEKIEADGLFLGHQQNDLAETVLKRVLEGTSFWHLNALSEVSELEGMRVLRPLLSTPKEELKSFLLESQTSWFEDVTNKDTHFLRARFREEIIPDLEKSFDKNVSSNILELGSQFQLLQDFFSSYLQEDLARVQKAPYGVFLKLSKKPRTFLECKLLLQKIAAEHLFFFSREMFDRAAKALELGERNKLFSTKHHHLVIDGSCIFMILNPFPKFTQGCLLKEGRLEQGDWSYTIHYPDIAEENFSWEEKWGESFFVNVPSGSYRLEGYESVHKDKALKKKLQRLKIPLFLRTMLPYLVNPAGEVLDFFSNSAPSSFLIGVNIEIKHPIFQINH